MAGKSRKICVVTGTRAEYGLLKSLMEAIAAHPRLRLQLVVTGMHLVPGFGFTVEDIVRDGWKISLKIPIYTGRDRREDLGAALGKLVGELSRWLLAGRSDFVVVLGDRVEALGGALSALASGIPLAHIHGGDIAPGEMDDRIRYAITSLANVHFASTAQSRARLIRTGQSPATVHTVGSIGLDEIYALKQKLSEGNSSDVRRSFGLAENKEMIMVVHHPCGFGAAVEYEHTQAILSACEGYQGLIIGPNSDPGHSGILRAIRQFVKNRSNCRKWGFFVNLDRTSYLEALWSADVLVGNSSSGVLEANALGTAAVDVGPRQEGRQRNGNAIIHCPYDAGRIRRAIRAGLELGRSRKIRPSRAFGSGRTGPKIADILAELPIDRKLLVKKAFLIRYKKSPK